MVSLVPSVDNAPKDVASDTEQCVPEDSYEEDDSDEDDSEAGEEAESSPSEKRPQGVMIQEETGS